MANMSGSLVFRSFGWNPQSHTEHQREVYLIWSSCPYRLLKTVLEQEKVFNAKSWDQMCEQRVSAKHVFKMPSPKQPSFGHRQKLCPNHPACQPIWSLLPCHWLCSQSWACPPALRSHTSDWRTTWATAGVYMYIICIYLSLSLYIYISLSLKCITILTDEHYCSFEFIVVHFASNSLSTPSLSVQQDLDTTARPIGRINRKGFLRRLHIRNRNRSFAKQGLLAVWTHSQ